MDFKVGDIYKCPEGHNGRIVWISDSENVIAVKCPRDHFVKVEKVPIQTKSSSLYRNHATQERRTFTKDMVFLIRVK